MRSIQPQNSLSMSSVSGLSFDLPRLLTTCTFLPFFTSVCSPGAQLPTEILSQSWVTLQRSSVHYPRLQNSQHTCCCLRHGVDEAASNPPLIWYQVQIHPPFSFQGCSLEGYFTNCVSYLLYWCLAAFCLLATSHSPLEQMGVCYLCTVENTT